MGIQTSTFTKIYVGTQAAASTIAEFQADTYTAIGEVESLGAFGDVADEIKFTSLNDGRVRKAAGVRDAGDFEIEMAFDKADAGQIALKAAFDANVGAPYNFKVELPDALTSGAGPHHGTQFLFKAVVLSFSYEAGKANEVVKVKVKCSVTSEVLQAAAA